MTPNVNFVSSLQAGNFVFDGAYVQGVLSQQALPKGPATNTLAIVGAGSWGIPNRVLTASGPQGALAAIGRKTSVKASAYSAAIDASPECNQFKFVRVTDGTDVAAKINLLDTATPTPATVLTLTAVCTGSDGNLGSARIDLASGTAAASPIYNITIYDPFGGTTVYKNIVGFSTAGGPYVAATFQANALAQINGTAANSTANPYYIATAGASTVAPVTGSTSLVTASGGTDGDSGVTDTLLLGTDAQAASTGMYVLRGSIAGAQLVLADFSTAADFSALDTFCAQEGAVGWETFAAGTTTSTAVSTKASSNMSSDNVCVVMDWVDRYDAYQGQTILVAPLGKAAGVVAGLDPWEYPSNKPVNGVVGVTTTERLAIGPIHVDEAAQRESNGILWIGPTANGVLGLPHGLTSSGRQINEVRMLKYLGYSIGAIMARFVGGLLESSIPFAQADEQDARVQCHAALVQFFGGMQQRGNRQISAAQVTLDDSNNTQTTMGQGRLLAQCLVTTLTGVKYAVAAVAVGNNLVIQTTPVGGQ